MLSIGMVMLLLGCGLFDDGQKTEESTSKLLSPISEASEDRTAPSAVSETPDTSVPPVASETPPSVAAPRSIGYDGPSSLEERVFDSPVIARVRLDSATSSVVSETILDGSTKYIPILEFSFSVLEYLKGRGSSNIVAYWAAAPLFDTRHEAEAALPAIVAARDTRWDDHEAIVFLQHPDTAFPSAKQPDRYYLSWGGSWSIPDDGYSIASIHNKLWLPAEGAVATSSQPSGDQQRFLLDVPPAEGTAPTITLGDIKTLIGTVTAKLDAGEGSEEYVECVRETYYLERRNRYRRETQPDRVYRASNISPPPAHQFNSGLGVGTVVYEIPEGDPITPEVPFEVWLDGGDASWFSVASPSQDYRITTTRPLPAGTYEFHFNHRGPYYSLCDGYTIRYEWTVTVNAPDGVLHELFFDPVTAGNAVAADSAYGVLDPASFTDANGKSTTIHRIAWRLETEESGKVMMWLTPRLGIAGHIVDFIALDGSVSLSLDVADATVDAANNTLSLARRHPSRGDSGDDLMVRIREAPPR